LDFSYQHFTNMAIYFLSDSSELLYVEQPTYEWPMMHDAF